MSENSLSCSSSSATAPTAATSVADEQEPTRVKEIDRDDTVSYSSSDEAESVEGSQDPYFDERMADLHSAIMEGDVLMGDFARKNSREKVDAYVTQVYQTTKEPQEAIFLNVRRSLLKVVVGIMQRCYRGGHIILPYYAFKLHPIRFEAWDMFIGDLMKMSIEFDLRVHQLIGTNRFVGRCDHATARHIFVLDMSTHASRGVLPSNDELKFFKPKHDDIRSFVATHLVQDNHFRSLALKTAEFEKERMIRRDAAKKRQEAADRAIALSVAAFVPPVIPDEVKKESAARLLAIRKQFESANPSARWLSGVFSDPPPLLPESVREGVVPDLVSTVDADADSADTNTNTGADAAVAVAPAEPVPAEPAAAEPAAAEPQAAEPATAALSEGAK